MAVMDYDPNMVLCGKRAKQTVNLTFGNWEYRKDMTVVVGGNCRGMTIIDYAVEMAFDELFDDDTGYASITMEAENGDTLLDDEGDSYEWLKEKLLKAEIVSIVADDR